MPSHTEQITVRHSYGQIIWALPVILLVLLSVKMLSVPGINPIMGFSIIVLWISLLFFILSKTGTLIKLRGDEIKLCRFYIIHNFTENLKDVIDIRMARRGFAKSLTLIFKSGRILQVNDDQLNFSGFYDLLRLRFPEKFGPIPVEEFVVKYPAITLGLMFFASAITFALSFYASISADAGLWVALGLLTIALFLLWFTFSFLGTAIYFSGDKLIVSRFLGCRSYIKSLTELVKCKIETLGKNVEIVLQFSDGDKVRFSSSAENFDRMMGILKEKGKLPY